MSKKKKKKIRKKEKKIKINESNIIGLYNLSKF